MMVDKRSHQVRRMFASVAHRYDFLNRLLSMSIDRYWRAYTRRKLEAALPQSPRVLDLCTGTGDLAFEFSRFARVTGCDFCHPMLVRALAKNPKHAASEVLFAEGDALLLPFPDESFDAVSIAFGLRNLEDYKAGAREMLRVLRPGGVLAVLEFSLPTIPLIRPLYLFYFTRVLPRIGNWLSGQNGPYSYLQESVREFPEPPRLAADLREVGFFSAECFVLTVGVATLTMACKGRHEGN